MALFDLNQPCEEIEEYGRVDGAGHRGAHGDFASKGGTRSDIDGYHAGGGGGVHSDADGSGGGGGGDVGGSGGGGFDLNQTANRKRRTQYTDDERRHIYSKLLQRNGGGIMKRGVSRAVSDEMRVPVRVVQRIWMIGRRGGGIHAVGSKKPKNCGRRRVELDPDALRELPLDGLGRMTVRELAEALGMKKSTLFQRLKEGELRRRGE